MVYKNGIIIFFILFSPSYLFRVHIYLPCEYGGCRCIATVKRNNTIKSWEKKKKNGKRNNKNNIKLDLSRKEIRGGGVERGKFI